MTTANEYKKYRDLLSALAEFVKNNDNVAGIDSFLRGYAGNEWAAAKMNAGVPSVRVDALDSIYANGDYQFFRSDDDRWIIARSDSRGTYRLLDDYKRDVMFIGPMGNLRELSQVVSLAYNDAASQFQAGLAALAQKVETSHEDVPF